MPVPPFASFDAAVSHLREIGKDGTAAKPVAKVVVVGPPGGGRKLLLRALAANCPGAEVVSVMIEHEASGCDTEQPRIVRQEELAALVDAAALGLSNTEGPVLLCTAPLPTALDAAEREAARAAADAALRLLLADGVPLGVVFVAGEQGGRLRAADLDGAAAVEGFVGPLGRGAAAVVVNGVEYAKLDETAAAHEASVAALVAKNLGERHSSAGGCVGRVACVPMLTRGEREDAGSAAMAGVAATTRDVVGALLPHVATHTVPGPDVRFELPAEALQRSPAERVARQAAVIAQDVETRRTATDTAIAHTRAVAERADHDAKQSIETAEATKRTTAAINAWKRRQLRQAARFAVVYAAVYVAGYTWRRFVPDTAGGMASPLTSSVLPESWMTYAHTSPGCLGAIVVATLFVSLCAAYRSASPHRRPGHGITRSTFGHSHEAASAAENTLRLMSR